MVFDSLNGTLASQDLGYLFIYANYVTNGIFVLCVVIAWWIINILAILTWQLRYTGRIRPEITSTVASFSTFILCVIMSTQNGLLNPIYLWMVGGITILSFMWLWLTD